MNGLISPFKRTNSFCTIGAPLDASSQVPDGAGLVGVAEGVVGLPAEEYQHIHPAPNGNWDTMYTLMAKYRVSRGSDLCS